MARKSFIRIKDRFIATHRWKDAKPPEEHLKDWHKHEFRVTVTLQSESDRGVEFWKAKRSLQSIIRNGFENQTVMDSCEKMAERIWNSLEKDNYKPTEIEVSEDGTSSGILKEI